MSSGGTEVSSLRIEHVRDMLKEACCLLAHGGARLSSSIEKRLRISKKVPHSDLKSK